MQDANDCSNSSVSLVLLSSVNETTPVVAFTRHCSVVAGRQVGPAAGRFRNPSIFRVVYILRTYDVQSWIQLRWKASLDVEVNNFVTNQTETRFYVQNFVERRDFSMLMSS